MEITGSERAGDAQQARVEAAHAGHRVDEDREHSAEVDHGDLRLDADPEPDDEQGDQHDPRSRVKERDERVEDVAQTRVPAEQQPARYPDERRERVADHELLSRHRDIGRELAVVDQLKERLPHVDRAGQEQRRPDARRGDGLPGDEEHRDAGRTDEQGFAALEPCLRWERRRPYRRVAGNTGRAHVGAGKALGWEVREAVVLDRLLGALRHLCRRCQPVAG